MASVSLHTAAVIAAAHLPPCPLRSVPPRLQAELSERKSAGVMPAQNPPGAPGAGPSPPPQHPGGPLAAPATAPTPGLTSWSPSPPRVEQSPRPSRSWAPLGTPGFTQMA